MAHALVDTPLTAPWPALAASAIPDELRLRPQWVAWRLETRPAGEKPTKVPYDVARSQSGSLRKASSTDSGTWCGYDAALAAVEQLGMSGVGFVFSAADPFLGIDLDGCLDPATGAITDARAREVLGLLSTYTETSVSGTGLHLIVRGGVPRPEIAMGKDGKKVGAYEMYEARRYFAMTGDVWGGRAAIAAADDETIRAIYRLLWPEAIADTPRPSLPRPTLSGAAFLPDDEILDLARNAKNGVKFARLWQGDRAGYDDDDSRADLALLSILAFYTQDETQLDRLLRRSGLYRPKWERADYATATIEKALSITSETYTKRRTRPARPSPRHDLDHRPGTPPHPFNTGDADSGLIKRLADAITQDDSFAVDAGQALAVYRDGVYVPGGERHIERRVKHLLTAWGRDDQWSPQRGQNVVKWVALDAPELWERPPLDTVNVLNGLLDVTTGALRPHDPAFRSAVQLPVRYDPAARCPRWDRFVAETFPADAQAVAYEIVACLMTPDTSHQKAILLHGEGANGKSVYLAAVSAFLGKGTIANATLQNLTASRFAVATLVGKLANICADLPSTALAETSMFKAITGGDEIQAERKYGQPFSFRPFARLVFSANHLPRSADASHAFFRRWLVVPFTRTFEEGESIPREQLDAALAGPEELSGLLNRALAALPDLRRRGFTESPAMQAAWGEFRQTTDPLAVWLDRHLVEQPQAFVSKSALQAAYNKECERLGRPPMSRQGFGRALSRLRPDLRASQRTVHGKVTDVWLGVGLLADAPPPGDSGDSGDSAYCSFPEPLGDDRAHQRSEDGGANNSENRLNHLNDLCLVTMASASPDSAAAG